jgi:hypothetical protein
MESGWTLESGRTLRGVEWVCMYLTHNSNPLDSIRELQVRFFCLDDIHSRPFFGSRNQDYSALLPFGLFWLLCCLPCAREKGSHRAS